MQSELDYVTGHEHVVYRAFVSSTENAFFHSIQTDIGNGAIKHNVNGAQEGIINCIHLHNE